MRVLMRVDVGNGHARRAEAQDLRYGFAFDISSIDASQREISDETTQCRSELRFVIMTAGGNEQRRDGRRIRDGRTVHQHDVAADPKRRMLSGEFSGFGKAGRGSHQRSGVKRTPPMQIENRAIHSAGQSKVVCVHNEAAHSMSLSSAEHLFAKSEAPEAECRDSFPGLHRLTRRNPFHRLRKHRSSTLHGRLAQLVRAPALQAGCRGFESLTAHHDPILKCPNGFYFRSKYQSIQTFWLLTHPNGRESQYCLDSSDRLSAARQHPKSYVELEPRWKVGSIHATSNGRCD